MTDSSIFIMDKDRFWGSVDMENIYYIETIKSTHYCEVKTKHGEGRLHADIIALQQWLPDYFYKSRASTLVNMKLVRKVDTKNRLLYFTNEICCSYTARRSKEIKDILNIRNYRNYKEEGNEKNADTAL